jgi:hypothetical protein
MVVRGKYGRIPSQNRGHGRMSLEFLVQELSDHLPAPPFRMIERRVEGNVPIRKRFSFLLAALPVRKWAY